MFVVSLRLFVLNILRQEDLRNGFFESRYGTIIILLQRGKAASKSAQPQDQAERIPVEQPGRRHIRSKAFEVSCNLYSGTLTVSQRPCLQSKDAAGSLHDMPFGSRCCGGGRGLGLHAAANSAVPDHSILG